jgi:hypothetical protein
MAVPTPDIWDVTSLYPILMADDVARWKEPPRIVWWDGRRLGPDS